MDKSKYYPRNCPQCNEIVLYKRKKDRNYQEKLKTICRKCSDKNQREQYGYLPKEEFNCIHCNSQFTCWRSQLSNPETPFCSKKCVYQNREDAKSLVGLRFGKLIVLERERRDRTTFYKCQCDCGNTIITTHSSLYSESSHSCGCLIKEVRGGERKPLQEVLEKSIWNYYKRNAKTRNYEWQLIYNDFVKLINDNCYYCGIEKCTPHTWRYKRETASLPFNGIDRIDNTIGYVKENCVSCCKICNMSKNTLTIEEFKAWIKRLSNNIDNF